MYIQLNLHIKQQWKWTRGALNIKHFSKLLQKTNDKKWLRTTKCLLCVPDVKEEWTLWLLALFELREGEIKT